MPTVHHPRVRDDVDGQLPARVTVHGRSFDVADDGTVSLPDAQHVSELARAYGLEPSDLRTDDGDRMPYEERKAIEDRIEAGECPWCDDYSGDGVAQHASSAHPDEWAAYKEGSD